MPTATPTPTPSGGPRTASVSSPSGEVLVQKEGSTTWVEATHGMKLSDGDHVKTGSTGTALIVFFEGSVMELEWNSEIVISQMQVADSGSTSIQLMQMVGKSVNRVEQMIDPASHYDVETPAGSAVVLGTTFYVLVGDQGYTTVQCYGGDVTFSAGGASVVLPAGMESSALPGGQPGQPQWIGRGGEPPPVPTPVIPWADLGVTKVGQPNPVITAKQLSISSSARPADENGISQAIEPVVGISINKMPSPPDSVLNDGTGVERFGWSITYNTTADFYAFYINGPGAEGPIVSGPVQFPPQPAPPIDEYPGQHSPIVRDLMTDPYNWAVPAGTEPGQYVATLEYYSVETGPLTPEDSVSTSFYVSAPPPVLTYTVTVTNYGPSDATGVTSTDTLPPGVTFVSATPSRGTATCASGIVTWHIGALASGDSETLIIVVTVNPETTGKIYNTVSVTGDQPDPNLSNNVYTEETTIASQASVALDVTSSGGLVLPESNPCA